MVKTMLYFFFNLPIFQNYSRSV